MKLALSSILLASAAAFTPSSFNGASLKSGITSSSSLKMETLEDLSVLAKKLNPIVPRFDPLGLSTSNFWGQSQEATIGRYFLHFYCVGLFQNEFRSKNPSFCVLVFDKSF